MTCEPVASETRLIVPLTQTDAAAMREAMVAAASAGADMVELRLDYLTDTGDEALRTLLTDPPCPVLATCRTTAEGGRSQGSDGERAEILARAAAMGAAWVDFELASMADAGALTGADRPAALIASTHDFDRRPADLEATLAQMESSPADVNKVAFAAAGPEDAWAAFDILRSSAKPAMALAMGEQGLASRVMARKFGAFGTFASLTRGCGSAPGQPTLDDLRTLYRWDSINAETTLFGVIGCPVGHSMSPAIHNASFAAAVSNAVYLPLRIEPGADNFNRFIDAVLQRPWSDVVGLSVTIPHKENALARVGAGNVDELARSIGAINTILVTGDPGQPLVGINTDYAAAIDALVDGMECTREDLDGREVAVLGAGGAARAIVAALAYYGAVTTVYNRTASRAEQLAAEFDGSGAGAGSVKAAGFDTMSGEFAEIIINCTPVGMHPNVDACPIPDDVHLEAPTVVFDTIYTPLTTRLLQRADDGGCITVSGVEMFINQAAAQFEFWTGEPAPRDVMREVVLRRLSGDKP